MTESRDEGLGGEFERVRRELAAVTVTLAAVTKRLDRHHELIGEQADTILDLAGPRGVPPKVTSWIDMQRDDEGDAGVTLAELADWVGRVYMRYPDGRDLPSCWAWHPDVVEELLWLWRCHTVAYLSRAASWAKVATWHHTERPGVVARIRASVGTCELSRHTDVGVGRVDTGRREAPLLPHLPLVAATWAERREAPAPDAEALADALRHHAQAPAW